MFWDLEKDFNRIYKQASKESKRAADDAVKEYYKDVESPNHRWKRLNYIFRFQPTPVMFVVFAVTTLILIVSAIIVRRSRYELGDISDLILAVIELIAMLLFLILTTLTVLLSDRASSRVNISERWQITANVVVTKWVEKYSINDLMLAFKTSLNTLKLRRDFYVGATFTIGAFITFFKLLIGNEEALRRLLPSFLGGLFQAPYIFTISFILIAVCTFVLISAPLAWREQLEPFLTREIEKYKAQRNDPSSSTQ
jgi:uncharacterized membrane protein YesL